MRISNPVIGGFHPDPSVCRVGDWYYLATSSFEFTPGVPIHRSRDLVNWELIGHALHRPEQLDLSLSQRSQGIWAPSLRHINGRFVMVTTLVGNRPWPQMQSNFYVTAEDPAGPWSDPVWVAPGGIDPDIVQMPDGRCWYLQTGGKPGMQIAPIDLERGVLTDDLRVIWTGSVDDYTEGPHLYHHEGWYYLTIAEGGTGMGHCVCVARARDPLGPYESCPHNPVLSNRGSSLPIQCAGHGDIIQGPDGDWWMLHLGIRDVDGISPLGRETCLTPVSWQDGWPVIGVDKRTQPTVEVPHCQHEPTPREWVQDFQDGRGLSPVWNHLRWPHPDTVRLADDQLQLACLDVGLDGDYAAPAWIGCRQQHPECRFTVDFMDPDPGSLVGVSVWLDHRHRFDCRLERTSRGLEAELFAELGDMSASVGHVDMPRGGTPAVRITARDGHYHFQVSDEPGLKHERWKKLGSCPGSAIGSTVAKGFTGAYFALWAIGDGPEERWSIDAMTYQPLAGDEPEPA